MQTETYLKIPCVRHFDPDLTFDCGQSFRFEKKDGVWRGVAKGRLLSVYKKDGDLYINCTPEEYQSVWEKYLSLDVDYGEINRDILERNATEVMQNAVNCGDGIRLLRQEAWETLCSFIISQNNNIPRIKKTVSELCERYGDKFTHLGEEYSAFPTPRQVLDAGEEGMRELKTGFRAPYIIAAANAVVSGELDLDGIRSGMSYADGVKALCTVKGVGPKVASCVLLFSLDKTDAFPVDVWVKRIIDKYFEGSLDTDSLGPYAGIAQQYLFYYERYLQNDHKS